MIVAFIAGFSGIIIAALGLYKGSKTKTITEDTKTITEDTKILTETLLADSRPNGGSSSRDLLDRLDRRSLNIEERLIRMDLQNDHRFDRIEVKVDSSIERIVVVEQALKGGDI